MTAGDITSSSLSKQLSILIPTYNRPVQLAKSLEILIPQCVAFGCKIVVIDNSSTDPVNELIRKKFPDHENLISVITNKANIGANANICRCFELCETSWMWLLGDDDIPLLDAVATICGEIEKEGDSCCMINFSSTLADAGDGMHICSFEELSECTKQKSWFSNFLFISTSIYRMDKMHEFIHQAYHFAYCCAPHLIPPLLALKKGDTIKNSQYFIVDWKQAPEEERWNSIYVILGLITLTDHPALRALNGSIGRPALKSFIGSTFGCFKWSVKRLFICPSTDVLFWSAAYCRIGANLAPMDKCVFLFASCLGQILLLMEPLRLRTAKILKWNYHSENLSRT